MQIQILIPPLPPWVNKVLRADHNPNTTRRGPIVHRPSSFVLSIPELTLSQRSRELTRPLRGCVSRGCEAVRALR